MDPQQNRPPSNSSNRPSLHHSDRPLSHHSQSRAPSHHSSDRTPSSLSSSQDPSHLSQRVPSYYSSNRPLSHHSSNRAPSHPSNQSNSTLSILRSPSPHLQPRRRPRDPPVSAPPGPASLLSVLGINAPQIGEIGGNRPVPPPPAFRFPVLPEAYRNSQLGFVPRVPAVIPGVVPGVIPGVVRDIVPQIVPEIEPAVVPAEILPEVVPEIVPAVVPEIVLEVIPEILFEEPEIAPEVLPEPVFEPVHYQILEPEFDIMKNNEDNEPAMIARVIEPQLRQIIWKQVVNFCSKLNEIITAFISVISSMIRGWKAGQVQYSDIDEYQRYLPFNQHNTFLKFIDTQLREPINLIAFISVLVFVIFSLTLIGQETVNIVQKHTLGPDLETLNLGINTALEPLLTNTVHQNFSGSSGALVGTDLDQLLDESDLNFDDMDSGIQMLNQSTPTDPNPKQFNNTTPVPPVQKKLAELYRKYLIEASGIQSINQKTSKNETGQSNTQKPPNSEQSSIDPLQKSKLPQENYTEAQIMMKKLLFQTNNKNSFVGQALIKYSFYERYIEVLERENYKANKMVIHQVKKMDMQNTVNENGETINKDQEKTRLGLLKLRLFPITTKSETTPYYFPNWYDRLARYCCPHYVDDIDGWQYLYDMLENNGIWVSSGNMITLGSVNQHGIEEDSSNFNLFVPSIIRLTFPPSIKDGTSITIEGIKMKYEKYLKNQTYFYREHLGTFVMQKTKEEKRKRIEVRRDFYCESPKCHQALSLIKFTSSHPIQLSSVTIESVFAYDWNDYIQLSQLIRKRR